jgi:hypothetical protein
MFSWDDTGDRTVILQMNAELRHAQLEMLSAQCATDRLRLRYSAEDVARHGQRDTLRKAWAAANALSEYYNSVCKLVSEGNGAEAANGAALNGLNVTDAGGRVAAYLREQRERLMALGVALNGDQKQAMAPYFSRELLEQARVVMLDRQHVPNPPFYAEARALGLTNLPELMHMASLTFEDVIAFQGQVTPRALFHALVHTVQMEVLGLEHYAELFVRGFLRTRCHGTVPLEAHVLKLEAAFAEGKTEPFSVEEKVRLWTNQGRY